MTNSQEPATRQPAAPAGATALFERAGVAKEVLDALQANLFVADAQLDLVYMNRYAEATLAGLGDVVRSTFGVRPADLLGGSIHRFHKNPARVESILRAGERLPHVAEFSFGGVTLATQINEVRDASGEIACYVVVWEDVTESRANARQVGRLVERVREFDDVVSTLESVAASMEELVASINEIARSSSAATATANEAVAATSRSEERVADLGEASARISSVVKLITEIASQTNLLALNATIEAARAGEAGRGFAVVASEVKELARGTADATGRIGQIVGEIEANTDEAVSSIAGISEVMRRIDEIQAGVAAAVEEQTAVASEVSRNLAQVMVRAQEIVRLATS